MTECERIVSAGILDESFFNQEMKCGFLVTKERKKIWAIELDMLLEVDRVCKKYNLCYFLFWGTLLGAVRHKGFIPWDDDTDIVMPRRDYELLLSHANDFSSPYFLQTPLSDEGYYYSHARLRNTNTSAVDFPFKYQKFNMGIFVDIQPIDNIDVSNGGEKLFSTISNLNILNSIAMRLSNPDLSEYDKKRVNNYPGGDPLERYKTIQLLSIRDLNKNTKHVSILAATTYGYSRDLFLKEDFDGSILVSYMGYKFPIPKGYDRILKTCYGDYMKLPPVEERGNWHSNIVFDSDTPYYLFLKKQ